jgi:hypothetical protein
MSDSRQGMILQSWGDICFSYFLLNLLFYPEDGHNMFLCNVVKLLPDYPLHHRRTQYHWAINQSPFPQSILTSVLAGGAWSPSSHGRFTPGMWTTWRRENSWPYWDSNSDPSAVQTLASRYPVSSFPKEIRWFQAAAHSDPSQLRVL